jgi:hypothetical protein
VPVAIMSYWLAQLPLSNLSSKQQHDRGPAQLGPRAATPGLAASHCKCYSQHMRHDRDRLIKARKDSSTSLDCKGCDRRCVAIN